MTLEVVGAGLGRTGTHSLKIALEQLLGGPCYHMIETFPRPDHVEAWQRAIDGDPPDWDSLLAEFRATVDWPACAFWREISAANPDAVVLLSSRDTDDWYRSMRNTILEVLTRELPPDAISAAQLTMASDVVRKRFTPDWNDEAAIKRAYEAHNADVRASVPADRLIDYRPGDGWEPICDKLGLPVPAEAFPHVNTTDEFRAMVGMEPLA